MQGNFEVDPLINEQVISSEISITSYQDACDRISHWATNRISSYVIAANVHVVMTAFWNPNYQEVVNQANLVTPDGMPLVFALRTLGHSEATRVYGPDLMLHCCKHAADQGLSIYLYGSSSDVLTKLQENLKSLYPELMIAGVFSPPYRMQSQEEEKHDIERIIQSGADIVFVSLGCPKQEEWMHRQKGSLDTVMIGVGAAFDFHAGSVQQAPRWMMSLGLEWIYRLAMEPRRLWKRYAINNPAFVILFCVQLLKKVFRNVNQRLRMN